VNASVEVAVVGAGPYGLSLAAHLDAAGISTRVFGRPMDSWRSHMPEGMLLKSDPFASNLSDARDFYTLARFSQEHSLPYNESEPVKLNTFCNYGLDFQKRCVPRLTEVHVNTIERNGDEFIISLDDGGRVSARRVVIAIGVGPFRYVPEILGGLPERFVSHSFDRRDLSVLSGARVAIIGGGSSAIDLAGLAHERGCNVTLISRRARLKFTGGGSQRSGARPWWRGLLHPPSGLGPGLRSRFSTDAPLFIHALPKKLRFEFVRRHLGPAASRVMKDKVVGRVPLLLERELIAAAVADSGVALTLSKKASSPLGGADCSVHGLLAAKHGPAPSTTTANPARPAPILLAIIGSPLTQDQTPQLYATAWRLSLEENRSVLPRRVFADDPVDRLPDQVGVAVVPCVLLDQVDQDPPQAG